MKTFDVHFEIVLSDFFTIEATSKEEAQEVVRLWFKHSPELVMNHLVETLNIENYAVGAEMVKFTDTVEV
jgi:hypothetical protein